MKPEILVILKNQHIDLQEMLTKIRQMNNESKKNVDGIMKTINNLKKLLVQHLALEDKEFYPQLLKKMKKAEMDINKTLQFITGMGDIAQDVHIFLTEYNTVKRIEKNFDKFKADFNTVSNALNVRIEAEEVFVFVDWEYLNSLKIVKL